MEFVTMLDAAIGLTAIYVLYNLLPTNIFFLLCLLFIFFYLVNSCNLKQCMPTTMIRLYRKSNNKEDDGGNTDDSDGTDTDYEDCDDDESCNDTENSNTTNINKSTKKDNEALKVA